MRYWISIRLFFAVLGLVVVLTAPSFTSADEGCGSVTAPNLCPNSCNQSNCQAFCEDLTPGPCEAEKKGHYCLFVTCHCKCRTPWEG
jgi:hypothetical protein